MKKKLFPKKRHAGFSLLLVLVVLAVVIVVAVVVKVSSREFAESPKRDAYQAVFLTNGQVYFGKLAHTSGKFVEMTDIYYLRANENLQKGDQPAKPQLGLVKLGNEVHAPEDAMYISREQILFWENLKKDSQVVGLIKQQKAPPAPK